MYSTFLLTFSTPCMPVYARNAQALSTTPWLDTMFICEKRGKGKMFATGVKLVWSLELSLTTIMFILCLDLMLILLLHYSTYSLVQPASSTDDVALNLWVGGESQIICMCDIGYVYVIRGLPRYITRSASLTLSLEDAGWTSEDTVLCKSWKKNHLI